jgi:hypothetical protein
VRKSTSILTVRDCLKTCALALALSAALAACSTSPPVYKEDNFARGGAFEHRFNVPPEVTFLAMKKIVLRQGYALEQQDCQQQQSFVASRQRQQGNTNTVLTLSAVVMHDAGQGSNGWINLQESVFVTDTSKPAVSTAASANAYPSVRKQRGETVVDSGYYDNLFAAVERELPLAQRELEAAKAAAQAAAEAAPALPSAASIDTSTSSVVLEPLIQTEALPAPTVPEPPPVPTQPAP